MTIKSICPILLARGSDLSGSRRLILIYYNNIVLVTGKVLTFQVLLHYSSSLRPWAERDTTKKIIGVLSAL